MDTFAVGMAAGISLGAVSRRQLFRFSWHFGLFQAVMPVAGWAAGQTVAQHMASFGHWLAFGLLSYVGGKALITAARKAPDSPEPKTDPTRGASLVLLSFATSIDAFAVGLSFAFLNVSILKPALVIGAVTAVVTMAGMILGSRLCGRLRGLRLDRQIEMLGGLILIAIGAKILADNLMA